MRRTPLFFLMAIMAEPAAAQFNAFAADNGPAWNSAVAAACAGTTRAERTIEIGTGVFQFQTRPDPIPCDGVTVNGTGPFTTTLRRMYSSANAEPFIELQGRGSRMQGFAIETAIGTSGGYGLYIVTNNDLPPGGKHVIDQLRITGQDHQGFWRISLHLRGDQRTVAPIGLRAVKVYSTEVFDAQTALVQCWGCVGAMFYGCSVTRGGGAAGGVIFGGTNNFQNRWDAGGVNWATSTHNPDQWRGPGR